MSDDQPAEADSTGAGGLDPDNPDEYRRLLAERDALLEERETLKAEVAKPKRARRRRLRRLLVGLLVALSCVGVVLSTLVVWTHRTVLNTDVFVATVGPVFENPAVTDQVGSRATNQLFDALQLQNRLKEALPQQASFIAGPATNGAKSFVSGALGKVLASSEFQKAWLRALKSTHKQVVVILEGQSSPVLSTQGGTVVLNTVPLINQALQQLSQVTSSLAGKPVKLPTVTSAELPQSAVDKMSKALGVQLPSNFGQITLFQSDQLASVQRGVKVFDGITVLLPLLTVAAIVLSLWLSLSRRRTLVQMLVVTALLMIVTRRVVVHFESTLAAKANSPDVASQVLAQLMNGLFVMTAWILGIVLAVLVVTLLTGPYRWAVRLRAVTGRLAKQVAEAASQPRRQEARRFTRSHGDAFRLGGAVLAAIVLIVVSVSWVSFLVVGVALVVYEILVNRVCSTALEGTDLAGKGPEGLAGKGPEGKDSGLPERLGHAP
jgi:hypothetical protein